MNNETEELLIAWRRKVPQSVDQFNIPETRALVERADKLIAEREPKIMSANALWNAHCAATGTEQDQWNKAHAIFLANIAAVLDRKLAAHSASFEKGTVTEYVYSEARRIVADALKVSS